MVFAYEDPSKTGWLYLYSLYSLYTETKKISAFAVINIENLACLRNQFLDLAFPFAYQSCVFVFKRPPFTCPLIQVLNVNMCVRLENDNV